MPDQRLDGIDANLEKLAQVTASFAARVAANDERIEKLIQAIEMDQQQWEQLRREWQAYLTTIHPRQ
jgi:parvulin-like peptidyl-prolyl isomerase